MRQEEGRSGIRHPGAVSMLLLCNMWWTPQSETYGANAGGAFIADVLLTQQSLGHDAAFTYPPNILVNEAAIEDGA